MLGSVASPESSLHKGSMSEFSTVNKNSKTISETMVVQCNPAGESFNLVRCIVVGIDKDVQHRNLVQTNKRSQDARPVVYRQKCRNIRVEKSENDQSEVLHEADLRYILSTRNNS